MRPARRGERRTTVRRAPRRGPLRSGHVLLALLLTVLTAAVVACGSAAAEAGRTSSVMAVHAAMPGEARVTEAPDDDGFGDCRPAVDPVTGDAYGACGPARCTWVADQPNPACCDSPVQDGISGTAPPSALPGAPDQAPWQTPAAYLPRFFRPAESGPGPPDLHLLQVLRT
ncbi:hypothetical protein [Streptomyces sp. DSM 41036]